MSDEEEVITPQYEDETSIEAEIEEVAPEQEETAPEPVEEFEEPVATPEPAEPDIVADITPTETPAAADPQEYAPVMEQPAKQAQQCVMQSNPVMEQQPKWPAKPRSPLPPASLGAQKLEITLVKEEGQSWGFRLGGGREFGTPLSVNRVSYDDQTYL